jgi:hypothetical protein
MQTDMPYRFIECTKCGSHANTSNVGLGFVMGCFNEIFKTTAWAYGGDMKKSLICNDEAGGPLSFKCSRRVGWKKVDQNTF